jgi:hypothetical protein
VLVHQGDGLREYIDQPAGGNASSGAAQLDQHVTSIQQALPSLDELPVEDQGATIAPLASAASAGADSVAGTRQGSGGGLGGTTGAGRGGGYGSVARLSIFGVTGEGTKFVFVFDRSGSMAGYNGAPLRAAKGELIRSLEHLEPVHQFQIIFYNEQPQILRPDAGQPRLIWGDDAGIVAARRFVEQISASGGTHHLDALKLALGMAPDVIFFLTDADEPRLTDAELRRVHGWNRHTAIHAIEFGHGRQADRFSFLARLAEQNGGQHAYVDISRL